MLLMLGSVSINRSDRHNFADDLLARNQLFPAAHQKNQQLHGLLFEFDSPSLAAKLVAPQVQFDLRPLPFLCVA